MFKTLIQHNELNVFTKEQIETLLRYCISTLVNTSHNPTKKAISNRSKTDDKVKERLSKRGASE